MKSTVGLALVFALIASSPTRAQIPVTDVGAILQLVTQVRTLQEQLLTAHDHLTQARETYASMTGPRGMENLLGNVVRNYLPPDWVELEAAIADTGGAFGALAVDIQSLVATNAILADADLEQLTAVQRQLLQDGRHNAAGLAVLSRSAVANSSERFESLQGLIEAIPAAEDPKAIADLQARIQIENGLLQNEATKLQALYQVEAAQAQLRTQRLHEQGIADTGNLRDLPALGL
jgi:type IV secretion system protein VirB5